MKIAFNPYISQTQYNKPSQAVNPNFGKKFKSRRISTLQRELELLWYHRDKYYRDSLKEFSQYNLNTKNHNGDAYVMQLVKTGDSFLEKLIQMEKHGEIQKIDWNTTDKDGNNLLMAAAIKNDGTCYSYDCIDNLIKVANEGKINVKYINRKLEYSLIECILGECLWDSIFLELNELDVSQTAHGKDSLCIIKKAINHNLRARELQKLLCHPKMDFKSCNIQEIYNYIQDAAEHTSDLFSFEDKIACKKSVETALRVHNAYKTKKYYAKNGMLTLQQILDHVNNTGCAKSINMKLNNIGETIGHFLAETDINPNDKQAVKMVNEIIQKLRESTFYFWQRDDIGRTSPMLALECGNFVVARAMLESMYDDEFKRLRSRTIWQGCHLQNEEDQEPDYRKVISKLEPARREEFDKLLTERINTSYR